MSAPLHLSGAGDAGATTAQRSLPLPVPVPVSAGAPPPLPPHSHAHTHAHAHAHAPLHATTTSYHPPMAVLPPLALPIVAAHPATAHAHAQASMQAHSAAANYYELYIGALEHARRLQAAVDALRADNDLLRARNAELQHLRQRHDAGGTTKTQSRYWTPDEHQRFLDALQEYGPKDVRAIATYVGTRNATQVRTHAQKYWIRVQREEARRGGKHSLANARRRCVSESDLAKVERDESSSAAAAAAATAAPAPLPASPPKSRFPLPKPGRSPLSKKPFSVMDIVSTSPATSSAMKPPLSLNKLDLDRPLQLPLPRPPPMSGVSSATSNVEPMHPPPPPPAGAPAGAPRPPLPNDTADDCNSGMKLLSMVAESSRTPMER